MYINVLCHRCFGGREHKVKAMETYSTTTACVSQLGQGNQHTLQIKTPKQTHVLEEEGMFHQGISLISGQT